MSDARVSLVPEAPRHPWNCPARCMPQAPGVHADSCWYAHPLAAFLSLAPGLTMAHACMDPGLDDGPSGPCVERLELTVTPPVYPKRIDLGAFKGALGASRPSYEPPVPLAFCGPPDPRSRSPLAADAEPLPFSLERGR